MNYFSFLQLHANINDAVKIFVPAVLAFIVGMAVTPIVSGYLYKKQLWKKVELHCFVLTEVYLKIKHYTNSCQNRVSNLTCKKWRINTWLSKESR